MCEECEKLKKEKDILSGIIAEVCNLSDVKEELAKEKHNSGLYQGRSAALTDQVEQQNKTIEMLTIAIQSFAKKG